jgi:UDP-glucose 4-epimerase
MVYGASAMNPNFLTEDMPLCTNSNYSYVRDKVEAEQFVERFRKKNKDICVTVLRPCWILGPTIQNYLTRYLYSPVIITLLGYDPLFQLVHEEDVIDAFRLAIEEDHPGIFNIVGRGVLPLSTLLKLAGKINFPMLHVIAYPLVDMLWAMGLFGAPSGHLDFIKYIWVADGEKAAKELGFTPRYSTKETWNHFIGIQRLREIKLI